MPSHFEIVKTCFCIFCFAGLWYLGPASILTCLPAVNLTEWKTLVPSFASLPALPSLPSLPSLPAFTSQPLEEEHRIKPEVTSQVKNSTIFTQLWLSSQALFTTKLSHVTHIHIWFRLDLIRWFEQQFPEFPSKPHFMRCGVHERSNFQLFT